jgi:hypothetical protein
MKPEEITRISKQIRELQTFLQAFSYTADDRGYIINGIKLDKLPVDQSEIRSRIRQALREVISESIEKYQEQLNGEREDPDPGETVGGCIIPSRMNGSLSLDPEKSLEFLLRDKWIRDGYLQDPEGMNFTEWLKLETYKIMIWQ